jgi:hypothetical protein
MSRKLLIEELIEVELLIVLGKEFAQEVTVGKIFLKVTDSFRELNFFIEPVENDFAHCIGFYYFFIQIYITYESPLLSSNRIIILSSYRIIILSSDSYYLIHQAQLSYPASPIILSSKPNYL